MARSVTALQDILRRSESLLKKLKETLPTIAHAKSAALLRQIIKGKQATIKTYKSILKEAKKRPAVKKTAKKAARPARPARPAGKKKTAKKATAKKGGAKTAKPARAAAKTRAKKTAKTGAKKKGAAKKRK